MLDQPGEYPNAAVRETNLRIPFVPGYTTGRLRAQGTVGTSLITPQQVHLKVSNTQEGTRASTLAFQLVQTKDISSSGVRTNIGGAVSLVRGGNTTLTFNLTQPYVEVQCVSGVGELDFQITSQVKFDKVSFLKSEAIYPQILWQASYATPTSPLSTNVIWAD